LAVVQVVVGEVVCRGEDAGVGGCCYGHLSIDEMFEFVLLSGFLEGMWLCAWCRESESESERESVIAR
jgi:hypothetical protein